MKVYLRKIKQHDITHQISITKEILTTFFDASSDANSSFTVLGKKSQVKGQALLLVATDPRFGGDIGDILDKEGGIRENDFILFYKQKNFFELEVLKQEDAICKFFNDLIGNDRHLVLNSDDLSGTYCKLNYVVNTNCSHSNNRIIFGAPGTGKSFILKTEAEEMKKEYGGDFERVTFHPDYSYANFVGTYKPIMVEDEISYSYVPGPFMRVLVSALKSGKSGANQPYLLVIEEINRANVAAVFGDVFQLLDRNSDGVSEYEIATSDEMRQYLAKELDVSEEEVATIRIPNNMFIWATMNSADQGVFPMDTAFKRRWDFTYLGIDDSENQIKNPTEFEVGSGVNARKVTWNDLRKAINAELSSSEYNLNEDKLMGPFFISQKVISSTSEEFISVFKNKVLMYLYDDAVKSKRITFFAKDHENPKAVRYSEVCKAFDEDGIFIFPKSVSDKLEEK